MPEIRRAEPKDVETLFRMILAAAEEQDARSEVTTSAERLLEDGFGSQPRFEALLAFQDGRAAGFILFFPMYSAWKGQRTFYVEDLFVQPSQRHNGMALALFKALEELALHAGANLAWEVERERLWLRHFFTGIGAIDRSHKVGFYMEAPEMKAHLGLF